MKSVHNGFRRLLKRKIFSVIEKMIRTESFRETLFEVLDGQHYNRLIIPSVKYCRPHDHYPELGDSNHSHSRQRDDVIFISARFRSGSTFLWNVFRHIPEVTAYYEPLLHETPRERGKGRNYQIDETHRGVEDYHLEYRNLRRLSEVHRDDWAFKSLHMDSLYFDPRLENYIDLLIEQAPARPVLQFNRADFRLEWLREHYPKAKLVHLFRNPRDQWLSMIKNDVFIPKDFKWDKKDPWPPLNTFYLWDWWRDLHRKMPFLKLEYLRHPYEIHYLLWRISYMYGRFNSDISIRFESLMDAFGSEMARILDFLQVENYNIDELIKLCSPRRSKPVWREYAPEQWFVELESRSEELLQSFFATAGDGKLK